MSLSEWRTPVRRAIGYALLAFALLASFGPVALLILDQKFLDAVSVPGQLSAGYSGIVTIATCSTFVWFGCWGLRKRRRFGAAAHAVFGALIGGCIALLLVPVTAGVSVLFGSGAGLVTAVVFWLLRRSHGPAPKQRKPQFNGTDMNDRFRR